MANPNLPGVLAWVAGEAAKVAVRATYGPRLSGPIERVIDRTTRAVGSRYGVTPSGEATDSLRPVDPATAESYWDAVALREWGVHLIVGAMGTGKSVVSVYLAERWQERLAKPSIWLGPDQAALDQLHGLSAQSVTVKELVAKMGSGTLTDTTVVIEDAMRHFDAYSTQTEATQAFHEFMAVGCRKQNNHCIINSQSAAIISKHILPTAAYYKRPHLAYVDEERGGQLARSRRAEKAFALLHDEAAEKRHVWVEDPLQRFRGLVPVPLPDCWTEAFSRAI